MSEESINIRLDDGTGAAFDAILAASRKQDTPQVGSSIAITTKDRATVDGRTIAVISFFTQVDGHAKLVQAVTTERLLINALKVIEGTAIRRQTEGN